jgi:hypothetical protein
MDRPSFGAWFIPTIAAGFAVVTAWAGHNVTLPVWGALAAYAGLVVLAVVAHWLSVREWRRRKKYEQEDSLNERIRCKKCAAKTERRFLYELPDQLVLNHGVELDWVCPKCYRSITNEYPRDENSTAVRAFPERVFR